MEFVNCPHCGRTLVKGAMKCVSCGKILKTPEDQIEAINRVRGSKKKVNLYSMIKLFLFILIVAFVYNKYSVQITSFVQKLLGR